MKNSVESVENAAEKKERRNIKVMDLILVIVGVSLLVFTIVMIQLFKVYGTVPDTLITCVLLPLAASAALWAGLRPPKTATENGSGNRRTSRRQRPRRQRCRPAICPAHNA